MPDICISLAPLLHRVVIALIADSNIRVFPTTISRHIHHVHTEPEARLSRERDISHLRSMVSKAR